MQTLVNQIAELMYPPLTGSKRCRQQPLEELPVIFADINVIFPVTAQKEFKHREKVKEMVIEQVRRQNKTGNPLK